MTTALCGRRSEKEPVACAALFLVLLMAGAGADLSRAQRPSLREHSSERPRVHLAPPGHYLEFSVCHACEDGVWRLNLMKTFNRNGMLAFAGEPTYTPSYREIEFIEILPQRIHWTTPLFVGPFNTRPEAQNALYRSAPWIARYAEWNGSPPQLQSLAAGFFQFGKFTVQIRYVASSRSRGSLDNWSTEAYGFAQK